MKIPAVMMYSRKTKLVLWATLKTDILPHQFNKTHCSALFSRYLFIVFKPSKVKKSNKHTHTHTHMYPYIHDSDACFAHGSSHHDITFNSHTNANNTAILNGKRSRFVYTSSQQSRESRVNGAGVRAFLEIIRINAMRGLWPLFTLTDIVPWWM